MKMYGVVRYSSTILDLGSRWSCVVSSMPRPLYPSETAPGAHLIGGWVCSRAALDAVEWRKISCLCRESNSGHPARSPSLHSLICPGYGQVFRFQNAITGITYLGKM
jgi:hypothetical protein